jgi:predicted small lipoprotein YifL
MNARRRSAALAIAAIACVAALSGCGAGGPTGHPVASTRPTPSEDPASRNAVDAVFSITDTAIRTIAHIKKPQLLDSQFNAMTQAGGEMLSAAFGITPPPTGVPSPVARTVYQRMLTFGRALQHGAACLSRRYRPKHANYRPCFAPFDKGGRSFDDLVLLVKAVISLEPYGSPSAGAQFRQLFESSIPKTALSA